VIVPTKGIDATEPVFRATIGSTPIVTVADAGLPESLRKKDLNNFAPRIGFAFRPFRDNRSVIRGGWGVFVNDLMQFPRAFPNQIITGVADFRAANQIDTRNPYTMQWHLTVEREIFADTGLRLSYIGSRTLKVVHQVDYNQPQPSTIPFTTARSPFPLWNTIFSRVNGQTVKFHSFQTEFDRRFAGGLTLQSSYSWTRNWTDGGGGNETGSLIEDSYDRQREYSNVEWARPHRWITTWLWELPIGRNRRLLNSAPAFAEHLIGGWELSGILLFRAVTGSIPFSQATIHPIQMPRRVRDPSGPIALPTATCLWGNAALPDGSTPRLLPLRHAMRAASERPRRSFSPAPG
jgi:hypothetical protein